MIFQYKKFHFEYSFVLNSPSFIFDRFSDCPMGSWAWFEHFIWNAKELFQLILIKKTSLILKSEHFRRFTFHLWDLSANNVKSTVKVSRAAIWNAARRCSIFNEYGDSICKSICMSSRSKFETGYKENQIYW